MAPYPLKLYIFGAGSMAGIVAPALRREKAEILAYLDESEYVAGAVCQGTPIRHPRNVAGSDYDFILVACAGAGAVAERLTTGYGLPPEKIVPFDVLELCAVTPKPRPFAGMMRELSAYLDKYPGLREIFDLKNLLRHPFFAAYLLSPTGEEYRVAEEVLAYHGLRASLAADGVEAMLPHMPLISDYVRHATFSLLAKEITTRNVSGSIAELGVFKGELAETLARLFPHRPLYLFDTFRGFDRGQLHYDQQKFGSCMGDLSDTSVEKVRKRLSFHKFCVFKPGLFPETAKDLDETFALVSLDVDIYVPTFDGLAYFYPRLAPGGYIVIHDYGYRETPGCTQAVIDYCKKNKLAYVPVADFATSAIIAKPR